MTAIPPTAAATVGATAAAVGRAAVDEIHIVIPISIRITANLPLISVNG
jgi:hypothetical protein